MLSSGRAFASTGACATVKPGNSFADQGATSATDTGCTYTDKTFSNFSVSGASCSAGGCTTSTTANTDFSASGALGSGATAGDAGTIDANLEPSGGGIWFLNGGTNTDTATLNYAVQSNVGAPAGAGLSWFIGGNVGLGLTGSLDETSNTTAGTNTLMVVETFCIDAASTTGCSGANSGTLEGEITYTNNGNGVGSAGDLATFTYLGCSAGANVGTCGSGDTYITLSSFVTEIAVSDTRTVSRQPGSNAVLTLTNIENSFGEYAESTAPESNTFVLLGGALAGLGLLRFRKPRA